jgi:Na+/proline symporter
MELFIIFGIIIVPLFLIGLFAIYKTRKTEQKKQPVEDGSYVK